MSSQLTNNPPTEAQVTAKPRLKSARKRNWRYGLAVLGALLMLASTFLPWVSVRYERINQEFSINGWSVINSSFGNPALSKLPSIGDGWLVIIVGTLALGLALLTFFLNRTDGAAILLVFGLFTIAALFYRLMDVNAVMPEIKRQAQTFFITDTNNGKISPPMSAGVGYGLLIALLSTLLVTLGGILPMAGKQQRKRKR